MIIAVPILDQQNCTTLVDQTLKLRAAVFRDILQWDVSVNSQGQEMDQFDNLPGTYLLSVDEEFQVQASLRLLPTTGPYMVSDVFQDLLGSAKPPRDVQIWESSRFFARPQSLDTSSKASRYWASQTHNAHIVELMCGLGYYCESIGVTHVVSVFDVAVERFLRRLGISCKRFGEPQQIGNTRAVAGMFPLDTSLIAPAVAQWGFDPASLLKHPQEIKLPERLALTA